MKKMKVIGIILAIIIVVYVLFITVEVIRFNNTPGVSPLIIIGDIDIDVTVESNERVESISGIGYKFEYEYLSQIEDSDNNKTNKLISGNFKLFGKINLISWII